MLAICNKIGPYQGSLIWSLCSSYYCLYDEQERGIEWVCSSSYLTRSYSKGIWTSGIIYSSNLFWPSHAKSWLIGKDSDAGRDWGQEEKGTTEDEMAGWHQWLNGRESQWTPGVGDRQGGLACCDSWGRKESDTTERLIWSGLIWIYRIIFDIRISVQVI